jgi:hypothetical protein
MVDRGSKEDIHDALPANGKGEMRLAASWESRPCSMVTAGAACEGEAQVAAAAVPPVQRSTPRPQGNVCKKLEGLTDSDSKPE